MELIILTNVSIILILFLLLSSINEHLGFEKFSLKKKKLIISVVLLVVNFIYFFDSYHEEEIIISFNLIILGIDILFILANFFLLIFKRKGFYFIFILLAFLFLIPSSCAILIFGLRGLPNG